MQILGPKPTIYEEQQLPATAEGVVLHFSYEMYTALAAFIA